jgi:hypothetical protein
LVNGSPEVMRLAIDFDEDLIDVPFVAWFPLRLRSF